MRAPLMAGTFPFPVKYGYAAVGDTLDGRRVFVLHPHQDVFVAPAAMCVPVPEDVPTGRAVLAANMETALNIVWDARPLAGERMLVIGAGVVGLLTAALLARLPAARVTVVDLDRAREALATAFGCGFATPDTAPGEQELIVHASGSEAGLRLALARAAFEARIVEASWFADRMPALPLGEAFHPRRLRLISSQVGSVAAPMRGRRTHRERLATALALLADPVFDRLLEPATDFADLPGAMPRLLAGGLCHVVRYRPG
jgi:threonine dehydrogenase-like Zn-dependent dehydrogenase